jgi:hypothetical protein
LDEMFSVINSVRYEQMNKASSCDQLGKIRQK